MFTRRNFMAAFAVVAIGLPAARADAATASPRDFLAAIYAAYRGKANAAGVKLDDDGAIRSFFEPSLAALIIKDHADARKRNEVPALDGDPFVDAQDWKISGVNITVHAAGADKAAGIVSFSNFDKPVRVVYDLVRLKEGWRIADIRWSRGESLRGIYKKRGGS